MINSYFDSNLKDTNRQIFDKLFSICETIEKRNVDPKVREILRDFLTNKLKSTNFNEFDDPASFLSFITEFLDFAHNVFLEHKIDNLKTLENDILKVVLLESLSISRQCVTKAQLKLNEAKSILNKLYDGVLVIDIKTRKVLACNKSIEHILKANNLVGQDVLNFTQDAKKTYYQNLFLKFAEKTKGITEILEFKTQNNDSLQLEASVNMLNESAMVVVFRDITKRLENEKLLVRLNRLYEVLSRINNLVVRIQYIDTLYKEVCNILVNCGQFKLAWIGCVDSKTEKIKPKAYAGYKKYLRNIVVSIEEDKPEGAGPSGIAIRENRIVVCNDIQNSPIMRPWIKQAKESNFRSSITVPINLIHTKGPSKVLKAYSDGIDYFDEKEVKLFEEIASDIAYAIDFIEKKKKITFLSSFDPLTNLPNRVTFGYTIESFVNRKKEFSVVMLDINNFTAINNKYGYIKGDYIIKTIAKSILEIDKIYYAARTGSDEFGFILNTSEKDEILKIAESIEEKIESLNFDIDLSLGFSVGVSIYPKDADTQDKLITNAEIALLDAKEKHLFIGFYQQDSNIQIQKKLELQNRLKNAIKNNEFVLYYQPKLSLSDFCVRSVEALLRWNSKDGIVLPNEFIPILEETRLIIELGYQIFEQAIDQIKAWQKIGFTISVAINLSAVQLDDANFLEKTFTLINRSNVDRNLIEIEVTESTLIKHLDRLTKLNEYGLKIFLDDFGTGYSSLSYLKEVPISGIKIDIAFIREMFEKKNFEILKTIINLSKALNLKVIAEGVETKAQANALKSLNCDEVQGFLIARPALAKDIEHLFRGPFLIGK
ncbi:diguanylate cyclase/phosphodiesterase (GGDEF / EAL domains) with PAS/PAC sensor(s) [Desulfurella amilsii]|uniref:Diguanylate cyclase/phosphodiesterase (GGDEF / EAL domains) with PAS/PAC sensor(S) n=1 Tax=Desulfurella amilsii TaxID=1562698 RepID=A0A1X4XUC0_9BACT|nr:EAL domain-containing protein [Desulfurella amilsii]OSS41133.1 diguanylate cyclase/phosphodiesterase (GGDEF / EAL domains) with PAS/PAC sensor(s) [Desulfurella amilsii]